MPATTCFPDLDSLLDDLVTSVRGILGDAFVGAYLLGSFALGDADEHSDVDFLVVTDPEVSAAQLVELQIMHARLYRRDTPWGQHLEGSYIARDLLRRLDRARTPLPFLDNGARELVSDPHCNTAVVRWTLRERGVALAGPEPDTLVDEITHAALGDEMRWMVAEYGAWARDPAEPPMSRWKQPYLVLTTCRILHTSATGVVGSKREAAVWALGHLDHAWVDLIEGALVDRADPWRKVHEQADAALAERTQAFCDYALAFEGATAPG